MSFIDFFIASVPEEGRATTSPPDSGADDAGADAFWSGISGTNASRLYDSGTDAARTSASGYDAAGWIATDGKAGHYADGENSGHHPCFREGKVGSGEDSS
jgi:hypothetical protein